MLIHEQTAISEAQSAMRARSTVLITGFVSFFITVSIKRSFLYMMRLCSAAGWTHAYFPGGKHFRGLVIVADNQTAFFVNVDGGGRNGAAAFQNINPLP